MSIIKKNKYIKEKEKAKMLCSSLKDLRDKTAKYNM